MTNAYSLPMLRLDGICENWTRALLSDSQSYAPFYQYPILKNAQGEIRTPCVSHVKDLQSSATPPS